MELKTCVVPFPSRSPPWRHGSLGDEHDMMGWDTARRLWTWNQTVKRLGGKETIFMELEFGIPRSRAHNSWVSALVQLIYIFLHSQYCVDTISCEYMMFRAVRVTSQNLRITFSIIIDATEDSLVSSEQV